jgi:hypothetical protein
VALLRRELRLWQAAYAQITRRPPPALPEDTQRIAGFDRGTYPKLVVALVVLLALEAPAAHVLVGALTDAGLVRSVLQMVLLSSSLYLVVWLLGDLRMLAESRGFAIEDKALLVELGQRASGRILLADIEKSWVGGEDDAPFRSVRLAVGGPVNCHVQLKTPAELEGPLGLTLRGDHLAVRVDDPEALVAALSGRKGKRRR